MTNKRSPDVFYMDKRTKAKMKLLYLQEKKEQQRLIRATQIYATGNIEVISYTDGEDGAVIVYNTFPVRKTIVVNKEDWHDLVKAVNTTYQIMKEKWEESESPIPENYLENLK